jgi:hypothetical protein
MENDVIHRFHYSGGGLHFFIGCRPQIQFKKTALYNFQTWAIKKFNLVYDKGSLTTLGDIARSFRVTNTFNFKRQRYCIPLKKEELMNFGEERLSNLAKEPRIEDNFNYWYGHKLIDLTPFDVKKYLFKVEVKADVDINKLIEPEKLLENGLKEFYNKVPYCIKYLLTRHEDGEWIGFRGRYLLTLYLRDQQIKRFSGHEIVSILKSVMVNDEWIHCATAQRLPGHNPGERLKPIRKVLTKLEYKFPSCFQLQNQGFCPRKCGKWHPIYK